ncbi:MAG: leucine-rich repeat domain-containing protein [Cyanobacteria bacterium MAG CAR3_bin_5]|nr:leucine-rich repeat domain-containing protein [Cyanobacteria bacterium MAG CAR3_bin_5]
MTKISASTTTGFHGLDGRIGRNRPPCSSTISANPPRPLRQSAGEPAIRRVQRPRRSVEELDLADNGLVSLSAASFNGLSDLELLGLNGNKLSNLS